MTKNVITINDNSHISKIVTQMVNDKIGSVVLTDEDGYLSGIFTESDLVKLLHKHLVDNSLDWLWDTPVNKVMSQNLITITEFTGCREAIQLMAAHRIRRLPIMDENDEELVGIITERDILTALSSHGKKARN